MILLKALCWTIKRGSKAQSNITLNAERGYAALTDDTEPPASVTIVIYGALDRDMQPTKTLFQRIFGHALSFLSLLGGGSQLINEQVDIRQQVVARLVPCGFLIQTIEYTSVDNSHHQEMGEDPRLPALGRHPGPVVRKHLVKLVSAAHNTIVEHSDGWNRNQALAYVHPTLLDNAQDLRHLGEDS